MLPVILVCSGLLFLLVCWKPRFYFNFYGYNLLTFWHVDEFDCLQRELGMRGMSRGPCCLSSWPRRTCSSIWLCSMTSPGEVAMLSDLRAKEGDLLIMLTVYMDNSANLTVLWFAASSQDADFAFSFLRFLRLHNLWDAFGLVKDWAILIVLHFHDQMVH